MSMSVFFMIPFLFVVCACTPETPDFSKFTDDVGAEADQIKLFLFNERGERGEYIFDRVKKDGIARWQLTDLSDENNHSTLIQAEYFLKIYRENFESRNNVFTVQQNFSGSIGSDKGIAIDKLNKYIEKKHWPALIFPAGYKKQIDVNGKFLTT